MPLNKAVRGLGDMLGLYSGGNVQLEASPWVVGGYDVLPFLTPAEYVYNTGFAGAAPWSVSVQVPEGELWLVNQIMGQMLLPVANDTATCYAFWNPGTAGGAFIEYPLQDQMVRFANGIPPGSDCAIAFANFDSHLIAQAGSYLGCYVSGQTSAGNLTMNIAVSFHRIRL